MSESSAIAKPHFSFEMKHSRGALDIDAAFDLTQPWTVLFGPSGSGKSTILRAIAGFIHPHHARIVVSATGQHQVLTDTAARVWTPPHKRFIRWAAQSPALFPHMTVRENLSFAIGNKRAEQAIDAAMKSFRIAHLSARKPALLSGGEQQRVSIARAAIATSGRLLLLDEPFSGLDLALRDELLTDLQQWLARTQTPVLSVTHDIAEALQLKAEVIKIRAGKLIAQGPAAVILAEERTRLLAQLTD